MPRRSHVCVQDVVGWENLVAAFSQAARGKRTRPEVVAFERDLDGSLRELRGRVLAGEASLGGWRTFQIRDPKLRTIVAPSFPDRVLHHALMNLCGPVLDRALVADTYACRIGKGALAAVCRAQQHGRRYPWFGQADVRAYFASIDHELLRAHVLARRFKSPGLLQLFDNVLATAPGAETGVGLPIGSLTSQWFANSFLADVDRWLLERSGASAMVRYMDDIVWWVTDHAAARGILDGLAASLAERRLTLKPNSQLGDSARGLSFLGFRVYPGTLRLSRRRRRRYIAARQLAERRYLSGEWTAAQLQAHTSAAIAITAHADAAQWRREQLRRSPEVDA